MNLTGGWCVMALVMAGFPRLREAAMGMSTYNWASVPEVGMRPACVRDRM